MNDWVSCWRLAGAALEALRRERLDHIDVPTSILALEDAFEAALRQARPRPDSGLVEQQRIFARLRG